MQESSAHEGSGSARSAPRDRSAVFTVARQAIWIFAVIPACFHPNYDHPRCGPGGECPSGLTCSAELICEGGGNAISDAGIDSPPDARVCFGTDPFTICLATAPTTPLIVDTSTPIDTTSSSMCVLTVSGGSNYCVIAATTISVDVKLRATGAKPLVLLASDSITVNALLDVGSHRGATPEIGAGADPATCQPGILPGAGGGGGGGGAGGSFVGRGGPGGAGGTLGTGGMPGAVVSTVTELRGGCAGQDGQGGTDKGVSGHGGGAVLLIAGNTIDVKGGVLAGGEGGAGGKGNVSGGGGGGSGGMIVLDAPTVTSTGLLLATGGGGGEGSDAAATAPGANGADATTTAPAAGGILGSGRGGDGGSGAVSSDTPGGAGRPGYNTAPTEGGGGAGGGGAGLIKAPATATLGTEIAPPATP